jgi:hypothetical protein
MKLDDRIKFAEEKQKEEKKYQGKT